MLVVKYRGADQVSRVSNGLAGTLSYFAEAEDALKLCKFVEKIVVKSSENFKEDFLGKPFRRFEE